MLTDSLPFRLLVAAFLGIPGAVLAGFLAATIAGGLFGASGKVSWYWGVTGFIGMEAFLLWKCRSEFGVALKADQSVSSATISNAAPAKRNILWYAARLYPPVFGGCLFGLIVWAAFPKEFLTQDQAFLFAAVPAWFFYSAVYLLAFDLLRDGPPQFRTRRRT